MKIEVDTVKGFQDYLPPESLKRSALKKIAEKYYRLYGFLPIETPLVEFDELMRPEVLAGEQEDEAVSDRFRLADKAGRNLGLRYEFTFQLARIFKQNPNIKLPFKRFQIGENFRDEPIRVGRTRQFTQCDIDIVGDPTVNADAECLAVIMDILKELKIEAEITVNNRKLLDAIIDSCEMTNKRQILREVDKLDKIGEDMVKANLKKYGDPNRVVTLFKLLEKDISFFKENAFDGAEELVDLQKACKQYGFPINFKFNLVRGFSYYTGNIFEIVVKGTKTALMGGGRYDKTVGKYIGREIPAVGISFSLEALMGICAEQLKKMNINPAAAVQLISIQENSSTIKLAKKLRAKGILCNVSLEKPGKSLEYADHYSIPFSIFIGSEEIKKGKFKLRNMNNGEEKLLTENQIIKQLSDFVKVNNL